MKRNKVFGAAVILFASAFIPMAKADLFNLTDVNADPNIFECDITAVQKDVTIGGATVHAMAYEDENASVPPASAGVPVQVIKVKVGDMIICRFKNQLSAESASIHWHGIELDNDSDGTPVSQDAVLPGQSYTYRFKTSRPGIFWFHSHMLPGNTLFSGIYGVLIIENNIEGSLITAGTLPAASDTYTLALSDIDFDGTGKIGKTLSGATKTENELIELCHLSAIGDPGGDHGACTVSAAPGATVLVNGQKPDAGAQTPMFTVPSGKRIRLRLLNESISRHFRLKLLNSGDNNLYRIGGQGGLLDNIVLEGGIKGTWDTKYSLGEVQIGSGVRDDVIIYPTGADGTIIQLVGNPTVGPYNISTALPANYPVAYFKISGTASDPAPAAGDPILQGTGEDIENIKTLPTVTPLIDPAPFGGSSDETIKFLTTTPSGPGTFVQNLPTVDNYVASLDSNAGNGDWLVLPRPPTARYAYVGDLLELTVRNQSSGNGAHPYHLHGFSMQPVRMVDNATGTTLYNFDYDEFVDTVDVQGGQSYVFRVRLDDRPKFCDLSPDYPSPN
ncbi:MAG TPA: multicopper oxidase domain-containing protein, partial [Verrucomicrobiae bacterium]|nr:multicopper oxidase domain-containing protein [Verrucomicrobiae bacterium]